MQPTAKVSIAGGVAGSLTVIIVWILSQLHTAVPPEVASAMTAVLAFAASWMCHFAHAINPPAATPAEKSGPTP